MNTNPFNEQIIHRVRHILNAFNVPLDDAELTNLIRKIAVQYPSELRETDINRATYQIVRYAFKRAGMSADDPSIKDMIRTLSAGQRGEQVSQASLQMLSDRLVEDLLKAQGINIDSQTRERLIRSSQSGEPLTREEFEDYIAALERAQIGARANQLERENIEDHYRNYRREFQRHHKRRLGCGCISRLLAIPGCLALSIIYALFTSFAGIGLVVFLVIPAITQNVPIEIPFIEQLGLQTVPIEGGTGQGSLLFSIGLISITVVLGAILFISRAIRGFLRLTLLIVLIVSTLLIAYFVTQTNLIDSLLLEAQNLMQTNPIELP